MIIYDIIIASVIGLLTIGVFALVSLISSAFAGMTAVIFGAGLIWIFIISKDDNV